MKITTTKSALSEAIAPFLKLNAEELHITVANGSVSLSAQTILARLLTTPEGFTAEGDGHCSVNLRSLKDAAACSPRQEIVLRHTQKNLLNIGDSSSNGINLVAQETTAIPVVVTDTTARKVNLPTGFSGFLQQTMQATSKDESRRNLCGVMLSKDGIVGTDGRQLMVIPLPMVGMTGEVTLPNSPVYVALRKLRWLSLYTWQEANQPRVCLEGIGFRLILNAIDKAYPNYRSVIPSANVLDTSVVFQDDYLDQLKAFLKGLPKSEDTLEITTSFNRVDLHCGDRSVSMPGTCSRNASVCCNPEYLLRALNLGHTGFRFNSKAHAPIMASGTTSVYLWMPMAGGSAQNTEPVQQDNTNTAPTPEPIISKNKSVSSLPHTTTTTGTTQPKEKTTMPNATTIPQAVPTVYRAATSATTGNSTPATTVPVPADPMLDLATAINEMRSQIDSLQSHLLEVGRKLKEAASAQRAKERIYQETTRKLDRIRLAM